MWWGTHPPRHSANRAVSAARPSASRVALGSRWSQGDLLHDERAMHAQQAGRRSGTSPNFAGHKRVRGFRRSPRNSGPVEDRNEHGGRQLDGGLLARHHLRLVLATGAVVRIRPIIGRSRVLVVITAGMRCLHSRVVTSIVIVLFGGDLSVGIHRVGGYTGSAHTHPRMEVAAAERHHHRQEQGDEGPEMTATSEHTTGEYIGYPGGTSTSPVRFGGQTSSCSPDCRA